jgi:hypothetical protein
VNPESKARTAAASPQPRHNDGGEESRAPIIRSHWNCRPYPLPMPRRWIDFLYRYPLLTFVLMVTFFLFFGVTSVNLFVLLKMNIDLFLQYGLMVIADGALEQLLDLVGSATLSIVFFLAFKVCERVLVEKLTAKKFGADALR